MGAARKLRAPQGPPDIKSPLAPLVARDRLVIVGKTGRGKGQFGKSHLRAELDSGRRVLAFDFCDEASQKGHQTEQVTLGPLRDRVTWEEFEARAEELLSDPNLSLAIVPTRRPAAVCAAQFNDLVDYVEAQGDLLLYVTEIGMWGQYGGTESLHYVAADSRHWNVPVIFDSQSMIDIPASSRRQTTKLISFQQTHPPDLDAIHELTLKTVPTFADDLATLGPGEFRSWHD